MRSHGRTAQAAAALLGLALVVAACSARTAGPGGSTSPQRAAGGLKTLAAGYLAIALPANRRLEAEVNAYTASRHHDLAVAESALRAQADTEAQFDRLLLKIPFPPSIKATARALVSANQRRISLTQRQARSASIAALLALTSQHEAADAAVEVQVRIIRHQLGLPPPDNS